MGFSEYEKLHFLSLLSTAKSIEKRLIVNLLSQILILTYIIVFRDEELESEAKDFLKIRNILSQVKDYAIMPRGTNRSSGAENIILGFII